MIIKSHFFHTNSAFYKLLCSLPNQESKSSTKNGDQMLIAASTVATGGTTMANVFILSPNGFKMDTMGFTLEITMKLRLTSSLL